jgi:hypothetical protein
LDIEETELAEEEYNEEIKISEIAVEINDNKSRN